MDFNIDNSVNNGWEVLTQASHMVKPGEVWATKPFVRDQTMVLYDREYVLNNSQADSIRMNFKVDIKRKMTFETRNSGPSAVGHGNIFIGITSDSPWQLYNYRTVGLYKQF